MPDEKFDEKELEKRDEKEEKSHEEKYQRDPLGTIVWACMLILAGLVLLAENLGYLERFVNRLVIATGWRFLEQLGPWQLILIGAGLLVLLEIILRLVIPEYRRPVTGSLIIGIVLIGLGLGGMVNWMILWSSILIILGVSILLRGIFRK